jgi:hypothetical protein
MALSNGRPGIACPIQVHGFRMAHYRQVLPFQREWVYPHSANSAKCSADLSDENNCRETQRVQKPVRSYPKLKSYSARVPFIRGSVRNLRSKSEKIREIISGRISSMDSESTDKSRFSSAQFLLFNCSLMTHPLNP